MLVQRAFWSNRHQRTVHIKELIVVDAGSTAAWMRQHGYAAPIVNMPRRLLKAGRAIDLSNDEWPILCTQSGGC
jgi:hypothetical protein